MSVFRLSVNNERSGYYKAAGAENGRRDKQADPINLNNAGKFFSPKTSERIAGVSAQNDP
jgi:hypothetical protein